MKTIHLTKQEAKDFLVNYHFINTKHNLKGIDGIKTIMKRLKTIQYDPLDVVGRNTDLVMQARIPDFKRNQLNKLLYKERYLIDGWDKVMSVYETSDFPLLKRVREKRSLSEINNLKHHLQIDVLKHTNKIINLFKEEGPKFSKDISFGVPQKHFWGQTKESSATLDYLFHKGVIGIHNRKTTHKQYDLLENLASSVSNHKDPFKTEEEFLEYYLLRRIKTIGLVMNNAGNQFVGAFINKKSVRTPLFKSLLEKELIVECIIEGLKNKAYVPIEALSFDINLSKKVSFIAPLDNIIWDRNMLEDLFDFEYRWEVYTPVKKRKYGYYVLPILYGSNFIGRIEFEKHRKEETLIIKNIWYQEKFKPDNAFLKEFEKALVKFSEYLGSKDVK